MLLTQPDTLAIEVDLDFKNFGKYAIRAVRYELESEVSEKRAHTSQKMVGEIKFEGKLNAENI